MNINNLFNDADPDINYNFFTESNNLDCKYFSLEEYLENLSSNKFLSIFSHNIRSFGRNFECLSGAFDDYSLPCIMHFSETRFKSNLTDIIEGYDGHHVVRDRNSPSGGTSIYVRNDIDSKKIDSLSYSNATIEVCTVEVSFNRSCFILVGIYRPHSDSIQNFNAFLDEFLKNPSLANKTCVLLGDLNICLLKNDQPCIDYANLLYSNHFMPLITKATRFSPVSNEIPSLLDHIWINDFIPHQCGIIDLDITDHLPIFINIFSTKVSRIPKIKLNFRINNQSCKRNFKSNIEQFDWNSIKHADPDVYMKKFLNSLDLMYCDSFPKKSKFISPEHYKNPWITQPLKKLINAKSQYFNLLKLNFISVQENNLFRNKVTKILRKHKSNFRKALFLKYQGNLKKTWNLINVILSKNIKNTSIKNILYNNILYDNDADIAEVFNSFFCSIGSNLDSQIPASSINPLSYINSNISSSFFLQPVSAFEVTYHIRSLKNSKEDIDSISVSILKENSEFLSFFIADLINCSFLAGKFPKCLKRAVVLPLFKKGETTDISNYRPISKLSPFSKIFEKCIKTRIVQYFCDFGIINPNQFGFQSNISTQDALIYLTEKMYQNLNNFSSTLAVYIDFSKAFDTVNRSILLAKLQKYGIRGIPLNFLVSNLDGRTQAVRVGTSLSKFKEINIGVPQGSVLGPILFLAYINDAPTISSLFSTCLFCDDTTLIFENKNIDYLIQNCNSGLNEFYNWCSANRLSINISKTSSMLFSNTTSSANLPVIKLNNIQIERLSSVQFLGITIDDNLKFNLHINNIAKKISKNSGILFKLRPYVDLPTLVSLYHSFIHCYINYCPLIFSNAFANHLKPLEVAQKKCIRIIANVNPRTHSEPIFHDLDILKVCDVYKFNLGSYMFKNAGNYFSSISNHNYMTRSGTEFYVPAFQRLTLTLNQSLAYQLPNNWNQIPGEIKEAANLKQFKKKYKKFLLDRYQLPSH